MRPQPQWSLYSIQYSAFSIRLHLERYIWQIKCQSQRERAFLLELDNSAPARFCVMQMQIQIKTECSFAVSIYIYINQGSRQHRQGKRPKRLQLNKTKKKKKKEECEAQSAKYPTEKVHLLDAFCAQHPEHRSLQAHSESHIPPSVNAATLI